MSFSAPHFDPGIRKDRLNWLVRLLDNINSMKTGCTDILNKKESHRPLNELWKEQLVAKQLHIGSAGKKSYTTGSLEK